MASNLIDCLSKPSGSLEAITLAIITQERESINRLTRLSAPSLPISGKSIIHALLISANNRHLLEDSIIGINTIASFSV